jgi:hypothetical protein
LSGVQAGQIILSLGEQLATLTVGNASTRINGASPKFWIE